MLWKDAGLLLQRDLLVIWEVILIGCFSMVPQTTCSYKAVVMV